MPWRRWWGADRGGVVPSHLGRPYRELRRGMDGALPPVVELQDETSRELLDPAWAGLVADGRSNVGRDRVRRLGGQK